MFDLWKSDVFNPEFQTAISPTIRDLINKIQPKIKARKQIRHEVETTRKSVRDEIQFCENKLIGLKIASYTICQSNHPHRLKRRQTFSFSLFKPFSLFEDK
jgi:hypothetical protein